jgi:hypothetical protein
LPVVHRNSPFLCGGLVHRFDPEGRRVEEAVLEEFERIGERG